jgi:glutamine synthetase adenylyltransferase
MALNLRLIFSAATRACCTYAVSIFGHSYWLGEALIRNPGILLELHHDQKLEQARGCEEFRERLAGFRARTTEHEIATALARFRKREYIRISDPALRV